MSGLRAHVVDDVMYAGVRVVLVQPTGDGRLIYGPGSAQQYVAQAGVVPPDDAVRPLMLRDDEARAILAALQRYFGEDAGDGRQLRRDYEAERARVDKLVDHLIARAS